MDSDLVPLVMIPRFTTYAGRASPFQYFATVGLEVSEYKSVMLNVWRGNVVGEITPGFSIWFEESTDQDRWTHCQGMPGGPIGCDPGENDEEQYRFPVKKRWFRVRVQLGGRDNVVSCWAVGFLQLRTPPPPDDEEYGRDESREGRKKRWWGSR